VYIYIYIHTHTHTHTHTRIYVTIYIYIYIEICSESHVLRSITNAPWYVSNLTLHRDLQIPFVTEEIFHHISQPTNTTRKQSGYRIQQPATRQTKTKTPVALRHSRERRRGITAHNSISYSVHRRIITG
jgi:hypothetical protein